MRFSNAPRLAIEDVSKAERHPDVGVSHDAFFAQIGKHSSPEDRVGGVLFVGGTSPADLAVRQAQAHLRLDRLPSLWSHAALILHWPANAPLDQVIGAEVALAPVPASDPRPAEQQVPERNGVTLFRLSRYRDHHRYPNLAFGTLRVGTTGKRTTKGAAKGTAKSDRDVKAKAALLDAVLNPCRDRVRYPLWEWIGVWQAYLHTGKDNPLLLHQAHPGAALCDYAYAAAGIDITPGADAPDTCPEMLWSTLLYWYPRLADQIGAPSGPTRAGKQAGAQQQATSERIAAWLSLSREESLCRTPLKSTLGEDFAQAKQPQ